MNDCVQGARIEERVVSLERDAGDNKKAHEAFTQAITDIRDRLLGRPSWPVVALITLLSSACVGLIVKAVSN